MDTVYVKLRMREHKNKYRKMLSVDERIYPEISDFIVTSLEYSAGTLLEEGEWFCIEHASERPYAIDVIKENFESVDYDTLSRSDFEKIDFLFVKNEMITYFQKISKSKLVAKKNILGFGDTFKYQSNCEQITINDYPDAVYDEETDILYFRKLEPIVGIFKGISDLYIEATDTEVEQFLQNDFIQLKDNYGTENVKTANRKRLALAMKTLSALDSDEKRDIFSYIGEYCPDLVAEDNAFSVGNEDELRMVLYGIEQRFYTTPVKSEPRIANSVIPLKSRG